MKKYILITCLLAVAGLAAWLWLDLRGSDKDDVTVGAVTPGQLAMMTELCTVEVYSEVPVLDTVGDKVMFGIQKQRGTISFDLDRLDVDASGDTVRIRLPKETIRLYEATEKDSWQVIDTKNIGRFGALRSARFSVEEENKVKSHIRARSEALLRRNGTVARARREAAESLTTLMSQVYRKPVKVS